MMSAAVGVGVAASRVPMGISPSRRGGRSSASTTTSSTEA